MKVFSLMLTLAITQFVAAQHSYLTLADNMRLYVEDVGEGKALIFIPGWTMTSRFFEYQKAFFKSDFRYISYDPRGQGRSDKLETRNNYAVHARDLRQIITQKGLQEVVLIGWSSGCLTIYEYVRQFGMEYLDKVVFIDEPPKWIGNSSEEWVYGGFEGYRSSLKSMISEPSDPNEIIDWMLQSPVDSVARSWMITEILMTPPHVALSLYVDGMASDYSEEVSEITVPSLFMVRSDWLEQARQWLSANNPKSRIVDIQSHAMFWETPAVFNSLLLDFIISE